MHNQAEQPRIFVHYNPSNCWYKRVFTSGQNEDFRRIDYDQMQFLLNYLTFDEERKITSVPDWESMNQLMEAFEDQKPATICEPQLEDKSLKAWKALALDGGDEEPNEGVGATFNPAIEPCTDCAAHCCKMLVFPQSAPMYVSNLDYITSFAWEFPGVEIGISDGGWSTVVKTTCRHRSVEKRCSLYGEAERLLICKYYDSWKCN